MEINQLIRHSLNAKEQSYAQLSNFNVGAAILCKSGNVYTAGNVEFSLCSGTICAERVALAKALNAKDFEIEAICVASSSADFCYPCGICRQALAAFGTDIKVVVAIDEENYKICKLADLLPHTFLENKI